MLDQLRGGRVGGYLRLAAGARVPHTTDDPASRPIVPHWPFLGFAGLLFVLNLPVYGFSLGYGWAALPASLLLAAPVAVAWSRPMIAWALALIPLIVLLPAHALLFPATMTPSPWLANQLAAHLPVIFLVAISTPRRICYPAVLITLAAGLSAIPQDFGHSLNVIVQGAVIWSLATVLAMVLGRTRLQRRNAVVRIAEAEGRRQVLEERTRIARELHDVVAHHMSVIAVQASTASYRIKAGPPAELDDEFRAIGTSARESLRELRQVLDVLRGRDDGGRPGLADLPKLIESTRLAGIPVRLTSPDSLPEQENPEQESRVEYAAYRIVQEALSNVIKHAAGAATTVRIDRPEPAVLRVSVINEPSRPGPPNPDGHGLVGMRERAGAIGGTVLVGPTESGGFRVEATLPLAVPITKGTRR
ncbi:sensor histidine kinase [Microlunatus speluncae]|uniref:sensor histidine kinase n=1 Tax=Microlunatus speluncae TaxID=2594267 RepID=UPI0012660E17|nr:histidine kinase [Microlunatus speluncae]